MISHPVNTLPTSRRASAGLILPAVMEQSVEEDPLQESFTEVGLDDIRELSQGSASGHSRTNSFHNSTSSKVDLSSAKRDHAPKQTF